MYFRQFWQDPRLSFEKREGLEKLVVGAEYINLIWVPDTFFVNEKTAYFHKATTENQFLRILHTGEILRSIRYCIFYFSLSMCISANAALLRKLKKILEKILTADSSDERRETISMLFTLWQDISFCPKNS